MSLLAAFPSSPIRLPYDPVRGGHRRILPLLHRPIAILAVLSLLLGGSLGAGLPVTLCTAPDGSVYIALSASGCCWTCEVEAPGVPPHMRGMDAADSSAQPCLDCSTGALPPALKQGTASLNLALRPEAPAACQSLACCFTPARAAPAPLAALLQSPLEGIILRC